MILTAVARENPLPGQSRRAPCAVRENRLFQFTVSIPLPFPSSAYMKQDFQPTLQPTPAETAIRALMEDWIAALRARDLDRLVSHYAPDLTFFDFVPPLSCQGAAAYRQKWEHMLPMFQGEIGYEVSGLQIHAEGSLGLAHCLNRIRDLSSSDRESPAPWVRITLGFRLIDGAWKVIHEHISVPIRFETMQPAMDLRP